eukprot:Colp12_sorted_trinity150504_noHs@33360
MSKSTGSTNHRKVDVDAFDEDNYIEDETTEVDNIAASVSARESEVRKLLNLGQTEQALKAALTDPPVTAKNDSVKEQNYASVMSVLTAFKTTEIPKVIANLSSTEVDVLMKYVYKGMSRPEEGNSGILLTWHEKALEVGGVGSIVRVMTDRKTV